MPVFGRINRLRRRRHDSEYPSDDTPAIATDDADRALTIAREAVDAARKIIATGRLRPFNELNRVYSQEMGLSDGSV